MNLCLMRLRTRRLMRLSSGDEVFALKLETKLAFNLCPPLRPLNALRVRPSYPRSVTLPITWTVPPEDP